MFERKSKANCFYEYENDDFLFGIHSRIFCEDFWSYCFVLKTKWWMSEYEDFLVVTFFQQNVDHEENKVIILRRKIILNFKQMFVKPIPNKNLKPEWLPKDEYLFFSKDHSMVAPGFAPGTSPHVAWKMERKLYRIFCWLHSDSEVKLDLIVGMFLELEFIKMFFMNCFLFFISKLHKCTIASLLFSVRRNNGLFPVSNLGNSPEDTKLFAVWWISNGLTNVLYRLSTLNKQCFASLAELFEVHNCDNFWADNKSQFVHSDLDRFELQDQCEVTS